jgi:O-antigen/teichoic acid export membrane protein
MTQQEPAAAAFASSMSIARLLLATAVGFLLPSFLIHRLPVDTYSAWVLILQMSAYVSYLDFGIQTGISKYVAEFEARKDIAGAGRRASAGLFLLIVVSSMGVVLTLVLAWRAPHLFHEMPASFDHGMQLGLILIGLSTAFSLFCSIFASIFIGLQRYAVPMGLALANKVLFVAAVMGAVYFHGGLAVMGALVALVNVTTGAMHFVAWRRIASHIRLSLRGLDYSVVRKMLAYCSTLATWSVAMLLISGLDVTIVGRYDFVHTGFYSIATAPTNFMLAIIGAALAPLMPAASASSVHRLPSEMGALLAKATRYTTSLLLLTGLPLMVGGYWILRIWVGHAYAVQVIGYMRILVLANILRNLCAPYANMLVATESQRFAIAGAAAESLMNVTASLWLVQSMGAIGVAYGTLIGSAVSICVHFTLSMQFTRDKLSISRVRLFLGGVARPMVIAVPSLLLLPLWWSAKAPAFGPLTWFAWGVSTILLAWSMGLKPQERATLWRLVRTRLGALS